MSLWDSKILYVFMDVRALPSQRVFTEDILGLTVIENEFHPPHHRHGVIKYDAGDTILALNLADSKFDGQGSDGIITVFSATPMREAQIYADLQVFGYDAPRESGGIFADRDNHHYALRRTSPQPEWEEEEPQVCLRELHLCADDMAQSLTFYKEVLDLILLEQTPKTATFATGNVKLVLQGKQDFASPPSSRRNGYLIVFHVQDINESYRALSARGLEFLSPVGHSDIGGSVRFCDPTGHVFCLYEPSRESLSWDSGAKVKQIISIQKGATV